MTTNIGNIMKNDVTQILPVNSIENIQKLEEDIYSRNSSIGNLGGIGIGIGNMDGNNIKHYNYNLSSDNIHYNNNNRPGGSIYNPYPNNNPHNK